MNQKGQKGEETEDSEPIRSVRASIEKLQLAVQGSIKRHLARFCKTSCRREDDNNTRRKQPGHSLGFLCALCLCIHAPAEPGTESGSEELMGAVWTEEAAWDLPHR